ncbi:hypothetical protein ACFL2D_01320 [Patescibacteria group bacterium]
MDDIQEKALTRDEVIDSALGILMLDTLEKTTRDTVQANNVIRASSILVCFLGSEEWKKYSRLYDLFVDFLHTDKGIRFQRFSGRNITWGPEDVLMTAYLQGISRECTIPYIVDQFIQTALQVDDYVSEIWALLLIEACRKKFYNFASLLHGISQE